MTKLRSEVKNTELKIKYKIMFNGVLSQTLPLTPD